MSASPYTPRPRCWRCKGRRVLVDPVSDPVQLVPCPACSHRDPPGRRESGQHVDHGENSVLTNKLIEARAA